MERNEENNIYKKINLMKNSLLINPSPNKKFSPNTTISISKIITPKSCSGKIDTKSQTSSNFLCYKINSKNEHNQEKNFNNLYYTKDFFTNNNDINKSNNNQLLINNIQLDRTNLRFISTRNIQNKRISFIDKDKNNSKLLNNQYINRKKIRSDVVKYRFLVSQKNYYKRMSNLKEKDYDNPKINTYYKMKLIEIKNSKSIKKSNYILLKTNNKKTKNNINKKDSSSPFPTIHSKLKTVHNKKVNKSNSIIYIRFNKDMKEDTNKLYKSLSHKNNFCHRINYNFNNSNLPNDEENSKIIKKNKNYSFESKKIVNDNYNQYLDNISTDSNKNKDNKKINYINKNIINKILTKKMSHKAIHIRKGNINLNKNKLSISSNNENKKIKNDFFNSNNIKSILRIKKISIGHSCIPEINKNIILNSLLREKLFHEC